MDSIDIACALEQAERDAVIAARWQPNGRQAYDHCADCIEEIPLARRSVMPGATRCLRCQTLLEAHQKQQRKHP